jgi:hypothetical protein
MQLDFEEEEDRDPALPPTHRVKFENPTREAIWRLDILTDALNQLRSRRGHDLYGPIGWMLPKVIAERARLADDLDRRRAAKERAEG